MTLGEEDDDGIDVAVAYAEHGASLFGFALNALGDRGAAEDCVQETFLRAWRSREAYRAERASQRTWLFAIARNVVVDAYRARSRRPSVPTAEPDAEDGPTTPGGADAVIDRLTLVQALGRLSPEHRQVIAAVHLRDLSYQQVAQETGVAVPTLRTRMYYGLRELRTIMETEVSGGPAR